MLKKAKSLEAEQMIQSVLSPQERLLWSGVPRQGFRLSRLGVFLILLGLIWSGCVIFALINALLSTHVPVFVQIWWIPCVLASAYCFFGRFIADKYRRSCTWYGITDQRVVLLTNWAFLRLKSLPLRGLNDVRLSERGDGSGTVKFGRSLWCFDPPWLGCIPDAREVYELILDAQRRELLTAIGAQSASTGSSDLNPGHA